MAEIELINNEFVQFGDVCALASYGTVIEYFSKKIVRVEQVLSNYFEKYNLYDKTSEDFYFKEKHKLISEHFHKSCEKKKIHGFKYIKQLHENNDLETGDYCKILDIQTEGELIVEKDLFNIRDILRDQDALTMVLYYVGEEMIQNVLKKYYHAITIGYDTNQRKYFYKDPSKSGYEVDDILFQKAIYEYIVFTINQ